MAIEKRYTEQMPFVGTTVQKDRLEEESGRRSCSIAKLLREMVDARYLLRDGEEIPPDEQAALAASLADQAARRADAARGAA